jgi:hypothetical protein
MRRHELDLVSLISGAVFVLVAVAHLVSAATDGHLDLVWIVPVVLVGLGVAGLASALRGSRAGEAPAPAPEPGPEESPEVTEEVSGR